MNEKTKKKIKVYIISVLIAELIGGLSALFTRSGMDNFENIEKPVLTPPPVVFPIVWGILFLLMGISAARIYLAPPSLSRSHGLIVYAIQLTVNFFWSIFFFNFEAYGFSFLWLLLLIILICVMIYKFFKVNKIAAYLQIPYILWCGFAAYLNYAVWMLNK